ncbi:PAS domain-containing hybrid sensor histidine kinase/response regulator [Asticcacaulis sp. AND118]|uniref:PAS domain-containing hybrid sensor histidine kinase/response regulator n=1 Tax=Asticcacaulis sp. AND118 TaxID=2840468 RepID=UPI001CFF9521|nr:PAS domain-containing hybrid sensor histidine kinase/response regulator [Asticcacaulis sp. AND118]UDF04388.1 PAS domain S-box protein [Asticcacaulis sp. AND118]
MVTGGTPSGEPAYAGIVSDAQHRSALLAAIVESSDDAIISKSLDGIITTWNASAERIFGYSAAEAVGRHITLIIPPEKLDEEHLIIGRVRAGERVEHFETVRRAKSGALVDISLTVSPVRDDRGGIIGASKIARDITRQKAIETQLVGANRRRDEFMANMSHELRTPMNAVIGLAHILSLSANLSPREQQYVTVLKQSGENLLSLINNLLDVSKIEAGAVELETRDFNLPELIEKTLAAPRAKAEEKNMVLSASFGAQVREYYRGDPLRLQQILANLLSNAVKFTDIGSVDLRISVVREEPGGAVLRFEVIDTGIGIPEDKLGLIFEKFTQGDASMTRRYGGTGLGLSIGRAIVERMGGTLTVTSTPGQGSTFTAELPLMHDPMRTKTVRTGEGPPQGHRNVLIVEDYEPNVMVVATLLEQMGLDYDVARTGAEALRYAEVSAYDLILMDVQMPGMDGFESTRRIRQMENTRALSATPVVAMTAHVLDSDRRRCFEAGMTGFIPKPFEPETFMQVVGEAMAAG